jgi:hypothetical protein
MAGFCLLSCVLLSGLLPCAAADQPAWRFSKEVVRGEAGKENIVAVMLDSDVYAATRPGYPDFRILDSKGQEVPYVMEQAVETRTHAVRQPCPSEVVSLHEQDGGIEVLVRLHRDAPAADGLTLLTPLKNYERRARVLGSDDGTAWTPLVSDALLFDYSRYMDISNREVHLPQNRCRQLKIVIDDITDARQSPFLELTKKFSGGSQQERIERTMLEHRPLRIDRLECWREVKRQELQREKKADYAVVEFRTQEDKQLKSTIVEVRTRREPLTELALETPSRNFSRLAAVEVPVSRGGRTEWSEVGRAQVSRVDFGGFRKEELRISFPEQRQREYRIVIHNEDSPPLEITGIKARGNVYRAVLLAAASETYRASYGSEEAEQPQYDAAAVLRPLREGYQTVEATLGPEAANPAAGKAPALTLRSLLNDARFLACVVVVLVAALGWALVGAVRRINQLPKE